MDMDLKEIVLSTLAWGVLLALIALGILVGVQIFGGNRQSIEVAPGEEVCRDAVTVTNAQWTEGSALLARSTSRYRYHLVDAPDFLRYEMNAHIAATRHVDQDGNIVGPDTYSLEHDYCFRATPSAAVGTYEVRSEVEFGSEGLGPWAIVRIPYQVEIVAADG